MSKTSKNYLDNHISQNDNEWDKFNKKCIEIYLGIDYKSNYYNEKFNNLLLFIGSHCYLTDKVIIHDHERWKGDDKKRLINAYKVIRHEIKYYYKRGISSREINSIRKSFKRRIQKGYIMKIPYRINYIFATIYDIIQAMERLKIKIPSNLSHCIEQTYRFAFYDEHYDAYITELKTKKNIKMHSCNRQKLDVQLEGKFKNPPFLLEFK